jgi:hypothetical protein
MATATATRRAPAPGRVPESDGPRLRVVGPPSRRRAPWSVRRTLIIAVALVLGSLLLVAGAQAYMTQQQVRLTQIESRLAVQSGEHRDYELRVAELSNPAHVVRSAQSQGLTVPSQVTDLPEVTIPPAKPTTTIPSSSPSNSQALPTAPAHRGHRASASGNGGT